MTQAEKQELLEEVLSSLRTNSAKIEDLTEVTEVPDGSYIELSGGKKIEADTFREVIQGAIYNALEDAINAKVDKTSVVQTTGDSESAVMSQDAVTTLLSALGVKIGNINLTLGTSTANNVVLTFTDDDGNSTSITLPTVTTSAAGVMSAADKTALDGLVADMPGVKSAKVTGASLQTDDDSATIVIEAAGGNNSVTLPKAGTIPTGETDPVAGVMSASQAQDLADVVLEVFPLVVTVTSSNAGVFEIGQSVTPAVALSIMRRGVSVASEATITTSMTVDGTNLSYEAITENTSFNISVAHKGSTVAVAQQQYRFFNYVYGDVLSAAPADIVAAISGASTLKELSARTTYNGTLAANKLFLFAVPGNVNLVCRHSETGAVISGCTTGTALVPRVNDANTEDSYSYIIVPASDVAWNFKITNT
jgi:hypothetical protein